MRNSLESHEKDMIKSRASHEKVMRKSLEVHEKVVRKSWYWHEKAMRKSWESHEKVMTKSWESNEKVSNSTSAADLCRHVCSCLFSPNLSELRYPLETTGGPTTMALPFRQKAMVKIVKKPNCNNFQWFAIFWAHRPSNANVYFKWDLQKQSWVLLLIQ